MIRKLLTTALLLLCPNLYAQTAIDGALLGKSESQLTSLFPDAKRLPKPLIGPHGLRGVWRLEKTPVANLSLATTFYTRGRDIMRIEQQGALPDPGCKAAAVYAPLVADMQARYGAGLVSSDSGETGGSRQSMVWLVEGVDVLLHVDQAPMLCSVLLIYQPNVGKDASTL
jgi:hypothetical protein